MQYRPVAIALCVLFAVSFASHQWYLQNQRSNTALGDIVTSAKLAFRTRLEAWEQTASALSCYEAGVDYVGGDIDEKTVPSLNACQSWCFESHACAFFTYNTATLNCYRKRLRVPRAATSDLVSGPRSCSGTDSKGSGSLLTQATAAAPSLHKFAVAITVMKPLARRGDASERAVKRFLDGAGVLATSVRLVNERALNKADLVAITHPDVGEDQRAVLRKAGYVIHERSVPVTSADIAPGALKEQVDESGCCGIHEMLKIEAYTLTSYEFVLHLDADCLLLQPVDELIAKNKSALYTLDMNLSGFSLDSKEEYWAAHTQQHAMAQGGFLLIKPSMSEYKAIYAIFTAGDFRSGTGWEGLNIGWGYGGQTFQGLIPFFYRAKRDHALSEIIDICVYDNMVDSKWCKEIPKEQIKIAHFTACQKPWYCIPAGHANCQYLTEQWWTVSRNTEKELAVAPRKRCHRDPGISEYETIPWPV